MQISTVRRRFGSAAVHATYWTSELLSTQLTHTAGITQYLPAHTTRRVTQESRHVVKTVAASCTISAETEGQVVFFVKPVT